MKHIDQIEEYKQLLEAWNKNINLVQKKSLKTVMSRHIEDSAQLCGFFGKNELIVDIGSGAGFPGMVLSILGYENVVLAEKNHKKAIFLLNVKTKLNLNVEIFNDDIRKFDRKGYTCVSRAFGSVAELLSIMTTIYAKRGVFHKGESFQKELDEAKESFDFQYQVFPSKTNDKGVIVNIAEFRRK